MPPSSNDIQAEPPQPPYEPVIAPCAHCGEPVASVCLVCPHCERPKPGVQSDLLLKDDCLFRPGFRLGLLEHVGLISNFTFVVIIALVVLTAQRPELDVRVVITAIVLLTGALTYTGVRHPPASWKGPAMTAVRNYLAISGVFALAVIAFMLVAWGICVLVI
jgi:hypothetical protein